MSACSMIKSIPLPLLLRCQNPIDSRRERKHPISQSAIRNQFRDLLYSFLRQQCADEAVDSSLINLTMRASDPCSL
ncbi:hypothetical protein M405DRAFT_826111 [Rhizopogon salebrosus TDB-379]|nr:hypothetical protein M405DRAFT_826111 [Rhizopogon salebrosus TDB-379]